MLNEPLLSSFGYLGLTENADRVMQGTFECPPGTDPYAIKLLKHFKRNEAAQAAPEAPTSIDVVSWQKLWAKAKERTSSHGAMHYGVFKAAAKNEYIALLFDATMTEIPMLTGYSPELWRQVTTAMLLKKAGV
jgi:hypothetical protein